MQNERKKVVVFGGGTGLSGLLVGLKDFPLDITAVITVSDSGHSTGKLRSEFAVPALGDIRKVITNLSDLPEEIKTVMEFRFHTHSDLDGHSVGNLVLTAMLNETGNLKKSIEYMQKLMDVKHRVLPLSEDYLTLVAKLSDGRIVENEDDITNSHSKIEKLYYKETPNVLPDVISTIEEADLIILSMGSLYTSILPHFICKDVVKAVKKSAAKVMYLCNAMTQPGETDNFTVSDHIKAIEKYMGKKSIDVVIASNTELPEDILTKYSTLEQKDFVEIDYKKIEEMEVELIEGNLLDVIDGYIRHKSYKLSSIIFSYLMR